MRLLLSDMLDSILEDTNNMTNIGLVICTRKNDKGNKNYSL